MFKKHVALAFLVILFGSIAIIGIETKPANAISSPVIVDSNPAMSFNILLATKDPTYGLFSTLGQSFNTTIEARLTSCKFYIKKYQGNPTANLTAYLYSMTGTYGTDSLPTGTPLATSDQLNSSTVGGSSAWYQFNFTDPVPLHIGTKYCIEISAWNSTGSLDYFNCVVMGAKWTSHSGNTNEFSNNVWHTDPDMDLAFYVYGVTLPVGGEWIPINTANTLVQLFGSAAAISAIAASFVGIKRIKKRLD